ncbi:MAG: hypothetical protein ACD_2C00228G0007 [uncultured bacterium (gcode 4)]|uniref:Dienelactone hydrolase domain-containing protein n=1 Tax=uncultured bacterium (gcode 4) TaxID=1234023 RepID=K2GFM4_9BACT|nr:MAG: hypothetical protein ACD_2C00228G0007 [uncultured bacterium (gcode 4)]
MKKLTLISPLLLLMLFSCAPSNDQNPQSSTGSKAQSSEVSTWTVAYFPWKPQHIWYFARPANVEGKYPALILIHEWWGLNDNIKSLASDFAKQGYIVLAADMYWGKTATDSTWATALAWAVSNDEAGAFENLRYAIQYLQWLSEVDDERIWTVWWCFWWWWAYQMAKNNLWTKVSVMYYWRFNADDDLSMMRSQILWHYWEKDMSISIDSAREFQAKLETLSWDHAVYIYPNVGHGFANNPETEDEKDAANLAMQRTLDFLKSNLRE